MRRGGKMRLSLKTKSTLAISVLVFAVVSVLSGLYIGRLTQDRIRAAETDASFVARQILGACSTALSEAAERGETAATPDAAGIHEYARHAFDNSATLNSLIDSDLSYSPTIYDILITDRDGIVLVSSDSASRGKKIAARPVITTLVRGGFFQKLRELYGPPQTYEFSLPFTLGSMDSNGEPFAYIRVGLSSALLRDQINPALRTAGYWALGAMFISTLLAFGVSQLAFAPIATISAQLDRISAGEFDAAPALQRGDELGAVSTKISGIGKQLRDVREIFSTLRENLDQVMTGLGDGL